MALFGRESEAQRQRAEDVGRWVRSQSPWALCSVALGLMGVIDSAVLVLGALLSVAAIVCGVVGLRKISAQAGASGRGLCLAGMSLGGLGLVLAAVMRWVVYPALAA